MDGEESEPHTRDTPFFGLVFPSMLRVADLRAINILLALSFPGWGVDSWRTGSLILEETPCVGEAEALPVTCAQFWSLLSCSPALRLIPLVQWISRSTWQSPWGEQESLARGALSVHL